jgi:uncharacterized protein YebE (UPF0316 family)
MMHLIEWLDMHPYFWPGFIFCARIADVSLGTLRTICVVRGTRWLAPLLGFFEVSIWVTAISAVLTHLDLEHWYNIVAYAAGFATGNIVGMTLEETLAIGMQTVRLISCTKSSAVAAGLRLAGYPVTEVKGHGLNGEVSISFVVVPRKQTLEVVSIANRIDPDVVSTIEDIRSAHLHTFRPVYRATGWRWILNRK